jgi:hypothetical protein
MMQILKIERTNVQVRFIEDEGDRFLDKCFNEGFCDALILLLATLARSIFQFWPTIAGRASVVFS